MLPGGIHSEELLSLNHNATDFLDAGRQMETEGFARKIHGKEFPAGDHPCHTRFRLMVDELLFQKHVHYDWFGRRRSPITSR
jgi:hypothetical protein